MSTTNERNQIHLHYKYEIYRRKKYYPEGASELDYFSNKTPSNENCFSFRKTEQMHYLLFRYKKQYKGIKSKSD